MPSVSGRFESCRCTCPDHTDKQNFEVDVVRRYKYAGLPAPGVFSDIPSHLSSASLYISVPIPLPLTYQMGQFVSLFRCTSKPQPESKIPYNIEFESCRSLDKAPAATHRLPLAIQAAGNFIYLDDGRKVLDACGGAAVACLGHGNVEVLQSMQRQAQQVSYIPWAFFDSQSNRDLCDWLIRSTGGKMKKAYLTSSGMSIFGLQGQLFKNFRPVLTVF